MPSSLPSVRPVLAALLTALLFASSVLVSGSATLLPAAGAGTVPVGAEAPAAPPEDEPVSMDLVSLTPTSLAPGGVLEAALEVTNTSSEPLPAPALELRTRTPRVTDRAVLAAWQADTGASPAGDALATSAPRGQLAPGESAVLTVRIAAEELGYSPEPYFWGTRRLALTVVADGEALSTLRTFVVWRPAGAEDAITQSVLLPLAAQDAAAMVTDPPGFAASAGSDRLAAARALAPREGVDWWLDPALLDPPMLPVGATDGTADEGADDGSVREFAPEPLSAALAADLTAAAGERTVLSQPYARADLVSLRAAGSERLLDVVRDRGAQVWGSSGIAPRASALRVRGADADADALEAVLAAGADAAIVPSSSLRADPASSITPSSVGVFRSRDAEGEQLALLAPDPVLSAEFSQLTADSDTERTRQRLLAETATIASEYATAPRHLLIAPPAEAALDPAAADAALDALEEAPWVRSGSTSTLLDAAQEQRWTGDPRSEDGTLFALGRIRPDRVRPSGPDAVGRWQHLDEAAPVRRLAPEALSALEDSWEQVDVLAAAMEDDAALEAPRRTILSGTSVQWRDEPEVPAARAREASMTAERLREGIQVVPASGYNVISDAVSVPITISNDLDTPITVRVAVTSDRPLVQVGPPQVVEVPARGSTDAAIGVEAVANGTVTLTTTVTTEDGRPLTAPAEVPLTVNPSWENWTTLVLVIAMGLLVVVGVARARRTGSSTRAPAMHGPEDPEELARTGRSTPDPLIVAPGPETRPDPETHEEDRP